MDQQPESAVLSPLTALTLVQRQEALIKTLADEASAAQFYSALMRQAPDSRHYRFIRAARDDELAHLARFQKLYGCLFGARPSYTVQPTQFSGYKPGLWTAWENELAAVKFYRDMQFLATEQTVKDAYYYAMVDELEHAARFGVLLHQ